MCTSSSSDGGSDGAGSSTPFLATWNGKRFNLENDFLFSKPRTISSIYLPVAKRMYEENFDQGDKYIIQNEVQPLGDRLVFQIREIEPEVSYIDSLTISFFEKKHDHAYFVTSDHTELLSMPRIALQKSALEQSAIFNRDVDVSAHMSHRFGDISKYAHSQPSFIQELEKDDFIEVTGSTVTEHDELYLLLESKYRDWTIGEIFKEREKILSNMSFASIHTLENWLKSPIKMVSLMLIIALSFIGMSKAKDDESQESILSRAFDINVARADLPAGSDGGKSLLVEYKSSADHTFKNIEIVEPRYFQSSAYLIKIPHEAIHDGKVQLRITATKRHHVTCARLIRAGQEELAAVPSEPLELVKAYNRRTKEDGVAKLTAKDNDYLVTWPGDVVDLEFKLPHAKDVADLGFVLQAHGFYVAASREIQTQLGDWVSRLDPESAAFLKELHTINSSKNRMAIRL